MLNCIVLYSVEAPDNYKHICQLSCMDAGQIVRRPTYHGYLVDIAVVGTVATVGLHV